MSVLYKGSVRTAQ